MELPPQPAQSTPVAPLTSPTPPSQTPPIPPIKPRKNYVLLIVLILIPVYIAAAYFLINKYFSPKVTKTAKAPTSTPIPLKEAKEKVLFTAKDIFSSWPGMGKDIIIQPDGSFKFFSIPESNQSQFRNDEAPFKVNGDFEIQFEITVNDVKKPDIKHGWEVMIFNEKLKTGDKFSPPAVYIQARDENFSIASNWIGNEGKYLAKSLLEDTPIPDKGNLRIRFEGIKSGSPETIIIYDGNTNKQLVKAQLPERFFSTNKFYPTLAIDDLTMSKSKQEVLTVSRFDIIGKEGSVTQ